MDRPGGEQNPVVLGTNLKDPEEVFEQIALLCSSAGIPGDGRPLLQGFPGAWRGREARGNDLQRQHPGGHIQWEGSLQPATTEEAGLNLEVARAEAGHPGREVTVRPKPAGMETRGRRRSRELS